VIFRSASNRTYSFLIVSPSSDSALMITWVTRPSRRSTIPVDRSSMPSTAVSDPFCPSTGRNSPLKSVT